MARIEPAHNLRLREVHAVAPVTVHAVGAAGEQSPVRDRMRSLHVVAGRSGVGQRSDDVVGGGDVVVAGHGGAGRGGGQRRARGGGPLAELLDDGGLRLARVRVRRHVLVAHRRRVARAHRRQRRAARPRVAGRVVHLHDVQERRAVVPTCTQRNIRYSGV